MQNISDFIPELSSVIDGLKNGTLDAARASQISKACGKITSSLRMQFDYQRAQRVIPHVPFLEPPRAVSGTVLRSVNGKA